MSGSSWLKNNSFFKDKEEGNVKVDFLKSVLLNNANSERYTLSCFNLCLEKVEGNNYATNHDCSKRCSEKVTETVGNFNLESLNGEEVKKEFLL